MAKSERIISVVLMALCIAVSFAMLIIAAPFVPENNQQDGGATPLNEWHMTVYDESGATVEGFPDTITAPVDVIDLQPGWSVDLETVINLPESAAIYMKTYYAPYTLEVNGKQVGTYGAPGTYPRFFTDPPPDANIFMAHGSPDSNVHITFKVPTDYWRVRIDTGYVGTRDAVKTQLYKSMGFEMFFAVAAIALGAALFVLSLTIRHFRNYSDTFLWLGIMAATLGTWILGECDLFSTIMKHPALLQILTYSGLFCTLIPITHLTFVILGKEDGVFRWLSCHGAEAYVAFTLIGQATNIWPFSKSLFSYYYVAIALIVSVFFYAVYTLIRHREALTRMKILYVISLGALGISMGAELANYYALHIVPEMFFAILGSIVFVGFIAASTGYYLKKAIADQQQKEMLRERLELSETLAKVKQRQYLAIIDANEELRRMRHDFKHQIRVIQGYYEAGMRDEMNEALNRINEDIPSADAQHFCPNFALNALASHYESIAVERGLEINIKLDVPAKLDITFESDLCNIVGNLLENGIRAATAAQEAKATQAEATSDRKPFVELLSRTSNGILTIVQDNSYVDVKKTDDGKFATTRISGGIGLLSIEQSAQKWGGNARFEAHENGVFSSSVYMNVQDRK